MSKQRKFLLSGYDGNHPSNSSLFFVQGELLEAI